jgi:1-acyl-sn-glycerol-3-phosphate acyltransferase
MFFFLFVFQLPAFLTIFIAYPIKIIFEIFELKIDHTIVTNYLIRLGLSMTDKVFFQIEHQKNPNIDSSKRYIYMPNHQSYVDPVIGGIIKNKSVIPVAGYLKYIPLMGYNAIFSGAPFVKYGPKTAPTESYLRSRPSITEAMISTLKNDTNIAMTIFPEGQRNFHDDIKSGDIKTGGFVTATKVGIDIVPIYHNMMDRYNDEKMEYHTNKKIYCFWGEPIKVEGKTIEQLTQEYYERMKELQKACNSSRGLKKLQ